MSHVGREGWADKCVAQTPASTTEPPESMRAQVREVLVTTKRTLHIRLQIMHLLCTVLPGPISASMRSRLYQLAGFRIHRSAYIMGNMDLRGGTSQFYDLLTVDGDVVIGDHVTINLDAPVNIAKNVSIGPHVLIYTSTHHVGPGSLRRLPPMLRRSVTLGEGSWIGLGAIILPGVTVGHGSVIAAGTVVAEDVPPNTYVEGNPARVVRELPWGDR